MDNNEEDNYVNLQNKTETLYDDQVYEGCDDDKVSKKVVEDDEEDDDDVKDPAKPFKIKYVKMPMPEYPMDVTMRVQSDYYYGGIPDIIAKQQTEYWNRLSRNKILMKSIVSYPVTTGPINKNNKLLQLIPGRHSHGSIIGNGISANHEAGHQFSLDHSDTRIWEPKNQNKIKYYKSSQDPWDPMTNSPGAKTLNPPHLHYLQWFNYGEEAFLQDGGEYPMVKFYDPKKDDRKGLKALYYLVPGSSRRYWFTYNGVRTDGTAEIVVHSATPGRGLTFFEGGLLTGKTHIRTGMIFTATKIAPYSVVLKANLDPNWKLRLPKTNAT